MKLPNIVIAGLIIIAFAGFTVFYNKKSSPTKVVNLSFMQNAKIDSVVTVPNGYWVYYPTHLVKVHITQKVKFVSPADTVVSLIDTSGQLVGSQLRLSKIDKELRLRIIEIILLKR